MNIAWWAQTHPGRARMHNEDAFLAINVDAREVRYLGKEGVADLITGDFVFAVSDGMGGANAGEYASRIAVRKISELLPRSFWLGAIGIKGGHEGFLDQLVDEIHGEISRESFHYPELKGMGATLSLVWLVPGRVVFAHVGDSRIYYLPKEGPMVQVTEDHTHVGHLLRTGQINEREARVHPRRHQLNQVLGGGMNQVRAQVGAVEYESGDRLVLCTDGITDGVFDRNMENMIRNPNPMIIDKNPAQRLVDEALFSSGRDNLTAMVIEIQ